MYLQIMDCIFLSTFHVHVCTALSWILPQELDFEKGDVVLLVSDTSEVRVGWWVDVFVCVGVCSAISCVMLSRQIVSVCVLLAVYTA